MNEVRFHGRGGQGAVTAAELVAQAAIASDMFAQGFPNFGAERRGAPVMAFLRVSDSQIFLRERIETPDVVVVLDRTLIDLPEVKEGLAMGKTLIINAPLNEKDTFRELAKRYVLGIVDAAQIAVDTIGVPITNTAIIGALLKATGLVPLEALDEPFTKRFDRLAEKNLKAMQTAYEHTLLIDNISEKKGSAVSQVTVDWDNHIKKEAFLPWQEVEIGCDVHLPGNAQDFLTGNWRTSGRPVMDREVCISCGLCWIMCPEIAFSKDENEGYTWSGKYCKGCGICVDICPKNALTMEDE
jgi:pyruvate ferredoxin oxidoreductase gamma subunit